MVANYFRTVILLPVFCLGHALKADLVDGGITNYRITSRQYFITPSPVGEVLQSVCVCAVYLSVCLLVCLRACLLAYLRNTHITNFLYMLHMAVSRQLSDGRRYVLQVMWMTSCSHICIYSGSVAVVIHERSVTSV